MKYKEVVVYTSYGEYSVNSKPQEIEATSIEEAAKISRDMAHLRLEEEAEEGEEELINNYIKEFFTGIKVKNGRAMVDRGEEDIALIIPFGDKWYDLVENVEELYNNYFEEWKEMIENF